MNSELQGFLREGPGPTRKQRRAAKHFYDVTHNWYAFEDAAPLYPIGVDLFGPPPGVGVNNIRYDASYTWAYTRVLGTVALQTPGIAMCALFIIYDKWPPIDHVIEPLVPDISEVLAWQDDPGVFNRKYPACPPNDDNSDRFLIVYRENFVLMGNPTTPMGQETVHINLKLDLRNLPFRTGYGAWHTWPNGGLYISVQTYDVTTTQPPKCDMTVRTSWLPTPPHLV